VKRSFLIGLVRHARPRVLHADFGLGSPWCRYGQPTRIPFSAACTSRRLELRVRSVVHTGMQGFPAERSRRIEDGTAPAKVLSNGAQRMPARATRLCTLTTGTILGRQAIAIGGGVEMSLRTARVARRGCAGARAPLLGLGRGRLFEQCFGLLARPWCLELARSARAREALGGHGLARDSFSAVANRIRARLSSR
jgi:hypothetical protein